MKTPFKNDPFSTVYQAFERLFPEKTCEIWWGLPDNETDGEPAYGATIFPDDGSSPQVFVSPDYPVSQQVEILAHELAHVVAGKDHEHDETWDKAFEQIHNEYENILNERFAEGAQ